MGLFFQLVAAIRSHLWFVRESHQGHGVEVQIWKTLGIFNRGPNVLQVFDSTDSTKKTKKKKTICQICLDLLGFLAAKSNHLEAEWAESTVKIHTVIGCQKKVLQVKSKKLLKNHLQTALATNWVQGGPPVFVLRWMSLIPRPGSMAVHLDVPNWSKLRLQSSFGQHTLAHHFHDFLLKTAWVTGVVGEKRALLYVFCWPHQYL